MADEQELCTRVAVLEDWRERMDKWQEDQNGKLGTIQKNVARLPWWLLGGCLTIIVTLLGTLLGLR
jgi:hypothetical protein